MFQCSPCNRTFTTSRALARHTRETPGHRNSAFSVHKTYRCLTCSGAFSRDSDLRRHEVRWHSSPREDNVSWKRRRTASPSYDGALTALGQSIPIALQETFVSPPIQNGVLHRRDPSDNKPILCTICRHPFETTNQQQLMAHLNDHFRSFKAVNRCEHCKINFVHKADLDKHTIAAAKGDCGYKFFHTKPCTGHHPPGEDHVILLDKIRNWQQCLLQSYIERVDQLSRRLSGQRSFQTELTDSCRGCRILEFFRDRFPEEYDDIYEEHLSEHPRFDGEGGSQCHHSQVADTVTEQLFAKLVQKRRRQRRASTTDIDSTQRQMNTTLSESKTVQRTQMADCDLDPLEILAGTSLTNDNLGLLHWAACAGDSPMIQACISNGADVNGNDVTGRAALHWAAACGCADAVQVLLQHDADVARTDNLGQTPLFIAVENKHPAIVKMLLGNGADPNTMDALPQASLHLAAVTGNVTVVYQLLAHGAQVDMIDDFGRSALHLAAKLGHLDAVIALCSNRASIDMFDDAGKTALWKAVEYSREAVVRYLLIHKNAPVSEGMITKAIHAKLSDETLHLMRDRRNTD